MTEQVCAACGGPVMPGHPAGLLAIRHSVGCPMYAAEDATRANDCAQYPWRTTRPATVVERQLLAALGHDLPDELTTVIIGSGGGYGRTWPQLTAAT